MTEAQILLIKKSWKLLRNIDPVLIGDVFYSKLFIDEPPLKHLFKHPIDAQSKKFVDMLSFIISRLDRLEELTEDIRQLAIRHVKYGVKAIDYDAVGNALLWTVQKGLGRDWNEEIKEAWAVCYQTLAGTMKNAVKSII
jgi:hemoglobin-like flavoprotein